MLCMSSGLLLEEMVCESPRGLAAAALWPVCTRASSPPLACRLPCALSLRHRDLWLQSMKSWAVRGIRPLPFPAPFPNSRLSLHRCWETQDRQSSRLRSCNGPGPRLAAFLLASLTPVSLHPGSPFSSLIALTTHKTFFLSL